MVKVSPGGSTSSEMFDMRQGKVEGFSIVEVRGRQRVVPQTEPHFKDFGLHKIAENDIIRVATMRGGIL